LSYLENSLSTIPSKIRAVFGFRTNQKSAGKSGRIMGGAVFGFTEGLFFFWRSR